jgi:hypothetical protein
MSSNSVGPVSPKSPAWDEAWTSVRRLAAARQGVTEGAAVHNGQSTSVPDRTEDDIRFISEQVQRDFAEIETASATLRHAQPDLEPWSPPTAEATRTNKPRSIWVVVGAVWVSTVLLMAMATLAIASLLR